MSSFGRYPISDSLYGLRKAPSERSHGFGVDTGVSAVHCFYFNSITGINDL